MAASQTILDEEGYLLGQAQSHLVGQVGSLAEVDEILERESEGDGLTESNGDALLRLVDVAVLTDSDRAASNVTLAGELDTLLRGLDNDCGKVSSTQQLLVLDAVPHRCARMHTGLGKSHQVSADALEFGCRHLNRSSVLCLGNGQVFLIDVHQLDIVLAQSVGLGTLEHQVDGIGRILGLEGKDIFVLSSPQDLGQGNQVDTEGNVTVAAVGRKSFSLEQHGNEGNMGVIHGL